jgi:hypothetical protein
MILVHGESGEETPGVAAPFNRPRVANTRKRALMTSRLSTERDPIRQGEEVLIARGRVALLDGRWTAKETLIRHLLNDGLAAKWTGAIGRSSVNIEIPTSSND